jgi:hypothetical protein
MLLRSYCISTVAASSNATLKTISTLAGQYDGMKVGMEMVK